jgi:integrase
MLLQGLRSAEVLALNPDDLLLSEAQLRVHGKGSKLRFLPLAPETIRFTLFIKDLQYFTYLNPLRYLIEITRGIFLKGTGIGVLWPQMLSLLVYGMLVMGLSAGSFRKRPD